MTTGTRPTNLTEAQAFATIDAMRTSADIKQAMKAQWTANAPGARFSVMGAFLRQNGLR